MNKDKFFWCKFCRKVRCKICHAYEWYPMHSPTGFKIIDMDKVADYKIMAYSWSELKQIINYSKQMNFKPKKDGE